MYTKIFGMITSFYDNFPCLSHLKNNASGMTFELKENIEILSCSSKLFYVYDVTCFMFITLLVLNGFTIL